MRRRSRCEINRVDLKALAVFAVTVPAASRFTAVITCGHHLPQQWPRQEALAISLVEDLVDIAGKRVRGVVEEFERSDRVTEAKLAAEVDVGRGADAFLDQTDRLEHQRMQQPIDGKPGYVLDPDRYLADSAQRLRHGVHIAEVGV